MRRLIRPRGRRLRRLLAATGIVLTLGVVVLDAHAALPEHHHAHGTETICVSSLAIAALFGVAALLRRRDFSVPWFARPGVRRMPRRPFFPTPSVTTRAGPPRLAVLRR
jgi:hypothetical protein